MTGPHQNRLQHASSPYLLQHASNPVDWYPWGPEALAAARAADRPIFLSVGYSACHWCHVMERESFEDPATARLLNEHFVSIKVDREERPDLDEVYMQAVQLFTGGHGGWPMSVFLTPQLEPFFGGTYFPPTERHGLPSFPAVVRFASEAYRARRNDVAATTSRVTAALREMAAIAPAEALPGPEVLDAACAHFRSSFDPRHGGFGGAPKFPHPMGLAFLLRYHARTGSADALAMATHTLRRMARGGIYDQLGGGFHRYSTDERWLVPHFEKMLYDNALLARVYTEAWQVTGDPLFRRVAEETLAYLDCEMWLPEGGFAAAQDADSEGEEGKYFAWSPAEIAAAAGAESAPVLCEYFDVRPGGNFESGQSVLAVPHEPEVVAARLGLDTVALEHLVAQGRLRLASARSERVAPGRDDKVVVAWNALAIRALCAAATALEHPSALARARAAAGCVLERWAAGPRLRTWRAGRAGGPAFLDDHAGMVAALLDLYEATFEPDWLEAARRISEDLRREFADPAQGGYFFTGKSQESPLARSRQPFDNVTPGGNSLQAANLLRLSEWTGEVALRREAEGTIRSLAAALRRHPSGMAEMLAALDFALGPTLQVVLAGPWDEAAPLRREVYRRFLPRKVTAGWPAHGDPAALEMLAHRDRVGGRAAAYVCRNFTCERPITAAADLAASLAAGGS